MILGQTPLGFKEKILLFSDSPNIQTGFGNQISYLMNGFADAGYDVYMLGLAYHGETMKLRDNITLISMAERRFGDDVMEFWLQKIRPQLLISLLDIYMDDYIFKIDLKKTNTKWIKWFPLDSPNMLDSWISAVSAYPYPVSFAEFSNKLIKEKCGRTIPNIPHMVDTEKFKPLPEEERRKLKTQMQNFFVVGEIGRNQLRKMLPRLLLGFSKFAESRDNARLLLHCGYRNATYQSWPAQGWDLPWLLDRWKIAQKTTWATEDGWSAKFQLTAERMNKMYNLMDLHWLSCNEGFGIPGIEAMAAGVPNVIADWTTGRELTNDGKIGKLVKTSDFWTQPCGVDWGMDDIKELADAFQFFYDNPSELEKHKKAARQYVEEKYSVKVVMPQWLSLIQKVLDTKELVDYTKGGLGV